jgi:ribosomal-protein-alanine N-acetyltransferase
VTASPRIRALAPGDAADVLAIQQASPEAAQWSAADYEQPASRDMICIVAEMAGSVGGFLAGRVAHDQFEILNLAVRPDWRRQGVATLLLNEALQLAAPATHDVFLEVRESNNVARQFYARHGFSQAGRRARYYAHPAEDAIILSRKV